MMNGVGGTTLHYWAQSWRLNPVGLQAWSARPSGATADRACPRASTVEDWPFGYDELEPYYDKVEWETGVAGRAGNIKGTLDPRGNVFEGPRQRDYPMPPLRGTGFTDLMAAAARSLGWKPFAGPAQINSRAVPGSLAVHVPRLLQPRRLPRGRKERDQRHHHPARARRPAASASSRART